MIRDRWLAGWPKHDRGWPAAPAVDQEAVILGAGAVVPAPVVQGRLGGNPALGTACVQAGRHCCA